MFIYFCAIEIFLLIALNPSAYAFEYRVTVSNNGPVVFGANITFTAELRTRDGKTPKEEFLYEWRDNLNPQNKAEFVSNATSNWTVHYSDDQYHEAGTYWVEVTVYTKTFIIDWPLCRDIREFEITDKLNGNLTLVQHDIPPSDYFISNSTEVVHEILLTKPDLEYIKQNSSSITIYWYIDCVLIATTKDLVFRYNYTQPDVIHSIDAFLMVTNLTLSNTTHPPVNLSASHENSSTEITTSSDVLVNTMSDSSNNTKYSYEMFDISKMNNVSFDCKTKQVSFLNRTHSTYGLFSHSMKVIAPVANVTASGNQWLQHWDMLNLTVTCQGTPPFKGCFYFRTGYYNATGNESCFYASETETCMLKVERYFLNSTHYSVVVIIENDINKIVRSFGVDVYEVTKHPQLSVIIVPISAAIVAVVLIIFGVAFYIQSRNRFMIEVADFDFSTNASDMEYKTFRERLVEAFHNAFDKPEDFYEQDSTNTAPTNKKYGSMP